MDSQWAWLLSRCLGRWRRRSLNIQLALLVACIACRLLQLCWLLIFLRSSFRQTRTHKRWWRPRKLCGFLACQLSYLAWWQYYSWLILIVSLLSSFWRIELKRMQLVRLWSIMHMLLTKTVQKKFKESWQDRAKRLPHKLLLLRRSALAGIVVVPTLRLASWQFMNLQHAMRSNSRLTILSARWKDSSSRRDRALFLLGSGTSFPQAVRSTLERPLAGDFC